MGNVFVEYIAPLFGNLLGVLMLLSPLPAVLGVRKTGQLGALNPLPYPLTALNCFGWIAYGLVLDNVWLLPANVLGLIAGMYFTLQSLPIMSRQMQDRMLIIICGSTTYFCLLGMIGQFALDEDGRKRMWGIQTVSVLLLYYAIPLTSMYEVIKKRDAESIYLPLAFAAVANGAMWTIYGLFATQDFNVWMPNGVGCVLGILQVGLWMWFGKPNTARPTAVPATDEHADSGSGSHFFQRVGSGVHLLKSFNRKRVATADLEPAEVHHLQVELPKGDIGSPGQQDGHEAALPNGHAAPAPNGHAAAGPNGHAAV